MSRGQHILRAILSFHLSRGSCTLALGSNSARDTISACCSLPADRTGLPDQCYVMDDEDESHNSQHQATVEETFTHWHIGVASCWK